MCDQGGLNCARIGEQRWRERVYEIVRQIRPIWNYRKLYLGGGNARLFRGEPLPDDVEIVDQQRVLAGGLRLWGPERTG